MTADNCYNCHSLVDWK